MQLSAITHPNKMNIEALFKMSMLSAVNDLYKEQSETIKKMKRADAIEKRKTNIVDKCIYAKEHLSKCTEKTDLSGMFNFIDKLIELVKDNNFNEEFNIEFKITTK